jgi:hypothetical protein
LINEGANTEIMDNVSIRMLHWVVARESLWFLLNMIDAILNVVWWYRVNESGGKQQSWYRFDIITTRSKCQLL